MDGTTHSITNKALKSTKWVLMSTMISKVWQPIVMIILARLLSPNDFGLMALALVVMTFMNMFQDFGLIAALIQYSDNVDKAANVVFWTNLGLGVIWYILLFSASPYFALFFDNKDVTNILRVIGLSFVIYPLMSVQLTKLSKEMEFKRLFFFNLVPAIIPGMISVSLALIGYGVWALVFGTLISSIIQVLIVWLFISWRPRWEYDINILKKFLGFGSFVSMGSFLGWGITQIDNLFVGKFLGAGQLGIYSFGWNIGFWPLQNVILPLTKIFYPMFSNFKGDMGAIKKYYLKILEMTSMIIFPIGVFILMTSQLFIPLLLGAKWNEAIPVIQFFSIFGIIASVASVTPYVYNAIGRPDIYPKFMFGRVLVSIPAYYFASQRGIILLCITHLILAVFFMPINIYISMRVLRISLSELLYKLYIPIGCSVIMGLCILIFLTLIKRAQMLPDLISLIMVIAFAIMSYTLLLYFGRRETFFEVKKLLGEAIF